MCPERNVDEVDVFFEKKHNFDFFSDIGLRFQFFGKIFRQKCQHFQEKLLAETKTFRPLGNKQEEYGFMAKVFSGVFNTALHVSRETFWDKRFVCQKNIISALFAVSEWRNSSSRLWQNFSTKVSKLKSTWPVERFEKNLFGGRYSFVSSYAFSEEKLTGKNNRFLSGMHSRGPAELYEGHFSRRNKNFQTFGLWARIFGETDKTHLTELPKSQSMWSEELLDWYDFYFIKKTTLKRFSTFSGRFPESWLKYPPVVSNWKLHVHNHFE